MANVRDRGQIILVTGLTIAVALVILTLLLNTVIFTQNLASRGTDTSAREAIEFRKMTTETLASLVEEENEQRHSDHGTVKDAVVDGLETVETIALDRNGIDSEIAWINTSSLTKVDGELIRQTNSSRALTNESGEGNWSLASDVPDTRAFTMTVDNASLVRTTEGSILSDDPYHLNLTSGGTTWTVYVYENSTSDEVAIATDDGSGPTERCSVDRSNATIDYTAGTVAEQSCDGLDWPGPITGSYDIAFRNGADANGTYALTINTSGAGSENTSNLHDGTSVTDSPYSVPAIYSANVSLAYKNAQLEYVTEIRVAEGEPS